jgi:hypothetical protein
MVRVRGPLSWSSGAIPSQVYVCSYCGNPLASDRGWKASVSGTGLDAYVVICHHCTCPTFIDGDKHQHPQPVFGESVADVSDRSHTQTGQRGKPRNRHYGLGRCGGTNQIFRDAAAGHLRVSRCGQTSRAPSLSGRSRTCWAALIGGCKGRLSREHLVSDGLLAGPTVVAIGFSWCKDTPVEVGLASLTAKHLCRQHNSDLSPVDQAGIDAFQAFRDYAILATERDKQRSRKWKLRRFEADGPLLERWFLRTGINLSLVQQTQNDWHLTGEHVQSVPELLVKAAFGLDHLKKPMGLYVGGNIGENIAFTDSVSFAPVLGSDGDILGFAFTFQGLRFLLWAATISVPDPLVLPNTTEPAWARSSHHRHAGYLRARIGGYLSHYFDVLWPKKKVPSWVYSRVKSSWAATS